MHTTSVQSSRQPPLRSGLCRGIANYSSHHNILRYALTKPYRSQTMAATSNINARSAGFLELEPYNPPGWASAIPMRPPSRVHLAMTPTPIHELRLPGLPPDMQLLIKRDDLSGMAMSGNKVRKLEFLLADALAARADCVITIGGIQSNHTRATAVAARYLGIDCHLILRTSRQEVDGDPGLVGNLLVERMVGAHLHLVTKEEYGRLGSTALCDSLRRQLVAEGRKPYVIPVGGSNSLGTWGYIQAAEEIQQQLQAQPALGPITDIAMACGSGGSTAGLALGSFLSPLKARVHAYGVCDTPEYFHAFIDGLLSGLGAEPGGELLGGQGASGLLRAVQARGAGYAISTEQELRFVQEVAATTGVILDPVYGGKALYGMLREVREAPEQWSGRTVLFLHTGGLLGMYDKVNQLEPIMCAQGPPVQRLQVAPLEEEEDGGKEAEAT